MYSGGCGEGLGDDAASLLQWSTLATLVVQENYLARQRVHGILGAFFVISAESRGIFRLML
jgi:hypothetical protein